MNTINHEGQEYVLKSEMEAAFKDRIAKLSSRAIQAEEQVKSLQEAMDNQSGELQKIEALNNQLKELGEQLQKSESRYERHTSMAEFGLVDAEIRELVEWQYDKAMKDSKEKVPLTEWLKGMKEDPTKAPLALRPHLKPSTAQVTEQVTEQVAPQVTPQQEQPPLIAPKTNTGATPAPVQSTDLLKRGADDFEFYKANRDKIRQAWRTR